MQNMTSEHPDSQSADIARAQLILAEKRTSLAVVRTAVAVVALPLSVITALIAFSRYYDVAHNLPLIIPLVFMCLALFVFGAFMLVRALVRIRHQDRLLERLKQRDPELKEMLD
ncbi:MAG: hypothetical protein Kow0099_20540 [Candidatus Abyssubacteria bacterium]